MIWYPYEQMKTMKAPYKILDAEGVHLYTKDQKLIDSISSWWCMKPLRPMERKKKLQIIR